MRIGREVKPDSRTLSKRRIYWDVPADLLPESHNHNMIVGIGRWRNTNEKYLLIMQNKEILYIHKTLLKKLYKAFKKGTF